MDGIQLRDEAVRDRIRAATEFLDPTDPRARSYRADIVLMLNRGLRRLVVSIDEIRAHNRELADGILYQPFDFSLCFDEALKQVIATLPNRPPKETAEDTVSLLLQTRKFIANAGRYTTAPTPAASEKMPAIQERSAPPYSTAWCHWRASSQSAR
jgi:DNA replication licensing factor MCM3